MAPMTQKPGLYPETEGNPNFSELEQRVLAGWKKDGTFQQSVLLRSKESEFVFYDGPPFANGLPHYGHLLTSCVKDLFARYQTMQGKRTERRFGWDCHGLPAEMEAEKELQVSGRKAIEDYGIDTFNQHCRQSVMKYTEIWQDYVTRAGRWVDFENDYKTMDTDYMESVLWAFKTLHEKGLVYESYRVMPYSWAAQTPLSNFETRMDDAYRERTDKAVTVAFKLNEKPNDAPEGCKNYYILAWTTTPWTLPSNLALGVSSKLEDQYIAIKKDSNVYIVSSKNFKVMALTLGVEYKEIGIRIKNGVEEKKVISQFTREGGIEAATVIDINTEKKEITASSGVLITTEERFVDLPFNKQIEFEDFITGEKFQRIHAEDLLGLSYEPLFPYFKDQKSAFKILDGSSFIEEGSGTGVVHLAPGFGEDDQRVCAENGIDIVCPVDEAGCYTSEIFDLDDLSLKGLNVISDVRKSDDEPYKPEQLEKYGLANLRIITWLKQQGRLIKQDDYTHSYPHCWRTDKPIIYKALSSWYVEVTKFKDRMVALNKNIRWIPDHIQEGQFGKWLENARDWSISRNRFWGTPIPVWKGDKGSVKVFGSISELEDFFEVKVKDLHRPFIDDLKITKEGETWTRVADVFDCWFESGSMPFAQVHYPFENKDWFETHFPADFIVEYIGQTRGWFYTLMVLATALFDKEPFKNCICHGIILDEHGKKLSKKLRNYPDPNDMFNTYGADAMRWRMISEPIMMGGNLLISKDGGDIRDVVRLVIKPIWNAYHFFTLYANADGVSAKEVSGATQLMDRYILSKLRDAVESIQRSLDAYDTISACKAVDGFFEALNNWYIRRSRDRFWSEADSDAANMQNDKQAAYDTLYTCLVTMMKAAAPLLPMVTEAIYGALVGGSVHLADFPDVSKLPKEAQLTEDMDRVRDICTAALAIRNEHNIRVRQPLGSLQVMSPRSEWFERMGDQAADIIRDEVNLKQVSVQSSGIDEVATRTLKINFPIVGKRLGAKMKEMTAASKSGDWSLDPSNGQVAIAGEQLVPGEFEITLQPKRADLGVKALSDQSGVVVLDLTLDDALLKEGIARDVVRMIQQARKDANLHVSDRIVLGIQTSPKIWDAISAHTDFISEQTLAEAIAPSISSSPHFSSEQTLEEDSIHISLNKVA